MDGNPPRKLRYLPAPADLSRPSLLSAGSALAKSDGLANGRTSRAEPWTMSDDVVVVYFSRLGGPMYTHERVTLSVVAETIAQIKGAKFAGLYDNAKNYSGNVFFVPDDTLVLDEASCLGIRLPTDLFGAVVPYPFAKTKAITHRLVDPSGDRPEGWSSAFAEMVQDVVLPGYTAFSVDDARTAAARLLSTGPIRMKEPLAAGGAGHTVATTIDEVEAFLEAFPESAITAHGLVVESNLHDVTTVSIGQITIDDMTIAYHGTQRVATNNVGCRVYGGSALVCVRGGWKALARLPMPGAVRLAAAQAKLYEDAMREYPGFMVSRRNYDVAQGLDGKGRRRSGVLEASWRSGGASTAELAALREFAQDPTLQVVEARAVKLFGRGHEAPRNAVVHYRGDDPDDGPITRYTMVTRKLNRNDADHYTLRCSKQRRPSSLSPKDSSRDHGAMTTADSWMGPVKRTFRSLSSFNYRAWAGGALVSNMGTWMQRTAQDWLVLTQLTHGNAAAVGVVMALQFGPQALLLPLNGFAADHLDRRKLLLGTQAAMGALALGLGILTVSGIVRLWHVYAFALLLGCVTAFDSPARHTFVSELVGEADLSNAVALNSTSFNVARMIGPGMAGVLIAAAGSGWVFLISAASFAAVLCALGLLRVNELHPRNRTLRAQGSLAEGFRYVWNRPDLKAMLAMLFLIGTFGLNFPIFISTMSTTVFHAGAGQYGLLTSIMAVGSIAGALVAARREKPHIALLLVAAAIFGFGCALAAIMPNRWLFGLALLIIGVSAQTLTISTNSSVQLATEPAMRGRVMAILLAVALGGAPIGAPIVGWIADRFGPRWALGVGAAAGLAAAMVAIRYLAKHGALRSASSLNASASSKAVGLKFPPTLLARADEVIE